LKLNIEGEPSFAKDMERSPMTDGHYRNEFDDSAEAKEAFSGIRLKKILRH
jgi:hypothetical protein